MDNAVQPKYALVLLAEDEPEIAFILSETVADAGCLPVVTRDGREALNQAREQWPDLVISDLGVPHLDGAGLLRELRLDATARGLAMPPIILVSGLHPTALQEMGADAYVRKPFSLDDLDMLLQRYLDR